MSIKGISLVFIIVLFLLIPDKALAIPSFSRQTNLACSSCHYAYPQLTPFGRMFKLNGYTMVSEASIEAKSKDDETTLRILKTLPLAAAIQASYTYTQKDVPGMKNSTVNMPQELAVFLAGEITPKIGSFIQASYEQGSGVFALDITDLRFADHTTLDDNDLLYGVTLNNSPTLQDVWQTGPMWSFPFVGSDVAPSPGAQTLFTNEDKVGLNVAGLGAYALYNNLIYGEFSLYGSTHQGAPFPADASSENTLKGVMPYWRLALQHSWGNQYAELGTFGTSAQLYPTGISGETDKYVDVAFDAQYENNLGSGALLAHTSFITENRNLDAAYAAGYASASSENLNTFKIDLSYLFNTSYELTAGYFITGGTADSLLYGRSMTDGFYNGNPNSSGITAQFTYLPWMNTQFALQYVIYNKFNGASTNYDGFGRNASDNNTLYLNSWIAF
jgi:hypothetical protein